MTESENSWLDEPAFEGVCPELTAYPEFRKAYIKFTSSFNKKIVKKEEKFLWPFTMSTAQ